MQNLITQLKRLYLVQNSLTPEALAQHLSGHRTDPISLASEDGLTRAMVFAFNNDGDNDQARHWLHLCSVANALQSEFGLPAPAVSISGDRSYGLWLSLESPIPVAEAHRFIDLLRKAYPVEMGPGTDDVSVAIELPPCLNQNTGKWAAFIHPGMGASFADESWLDMAPPLAGQIAFLKELQSISKTQFLSALKKLQVLKPVENIPMPLCVVPGDELLLRDATIEDIVRLLHSKNIEPTFRYLIP